MVASPELKDGPYALYSYSRALRTRLVRGERQLGSVRPKFIKNAAKKLRQLYPNTFTTDFETNKRLVEQLTDVEAKKVRNRIAGYLVTLEKIAIAREASEAQAAQEEVIDMEM